MPTITKAQAVTLLAQYYNKQRQEGETDLELVQRIRNAKRTRIQEIATRSLQQLDEQLKRIALEEYYKANPEAEEQVEDF